MGVALYRWGAMAQSNSLSDSSPGEESLRRTSAGAEFQSLMVRGKTEKPKRIKHKMYIVMFKFNLIKSTLRIRLGLGLKVRVMGFLMMHIT